jgi:DNA-binding transcriptional ArsR family regulator
MRNNEKKEVMSYAEKVASQMKRGLSNERSKIVEIGMVLREFGESPSVVSYHLNVDEDFIPDVLQAYKGPQKRQPSSSRASSHWPHN